MTNPEIPGPAFVREQGNDLVENLARWCENGDTEGIARQLDLIETWTKSLRSRLRLRGAVSGGRAPSGSPAPPPRNHAVPPAPPPPRRDLGWWTLSGDALLDALNDVAGGADPGTVYAELYANSRGGGADDR